MRLVSHAGTVLLAELAERIGLTALLSEATHGLRQRRSGHDPGRVLGGVDGPMLARVRAARAQHGTGPGSPAQS